MTQSFEVFNEEKARGMACSTVSGCIAGGLTVAGVKLGMKTTTSAVVFLYIVGNIMTYAADIMFAKRSFLQDGRIVRLPYDAFHKRSAYLLRSFVGRKFVKFGVTVLLDTLIGLALLRAATRFMDENDFLVHFKYRDAITAILITIFTFMLYLNILRFDWAYSDVENPMLNVTVLMWSTLVLLFSIGIGYSAPAKRNWVADVALPVAPAS